MNNSKYRDFLVKNTNSIIKINYYTTMNENPSLQFNTNTNTITNSHYIFNGIQDNSKPYGYEESLPKNMYISNQQLNDKKYRPLQYGY